MAAEPRTPSGDDGSRLGATVQEITERAQLLVREEIELAKAELGVKVQKLVRAAAVGGAAAVFVLAALQVLLFTIGFGLGDLFNGNVHVWVGFAVTTLLLLILAGVAGFLAYRWVKQGSPPKPEMAIEEAQRIKRTIQDARS